MPVYEQIINPYNAALRVLGADVGSGVDGFMIGAHEIMSFSRNRSGGMDHTPGERQYVVWDVFMSKLTGALSYIEEKVTTAPEPLGPPPIPREELRSVLLNIVDAHYQRPPMARSFRATRTDTGLALYPSDEGDQPILQLAWGQVNELQDGGFLTFFKGRAVIIEDAGIDAYKEIVRLDEAIRPEGQPIERRSPMNNKIWVIHGHDQKAREVVFALLTAVGLQPLEFDQAADLTGKPSPTIMEILTAAFREGQAFVALLTPDEEAVPAAAFAEVDEPGPHLQPRPNVVLEAGMAFAYDPDRTVIVEMGKIREISDLGGIHTVKWRQDRYETRKSLLRKLRLAQCPVNDSGDLWVRAGGTYP